MLQVIIHDTHMGAVQAMNTFKRWVYNPPGMNLYLLASSYLEVSNYSNSEPPRDERETCTRKYCGGRKMFCYLF